MDLRVYLENIETGEGEWVDAEYADTSDYDNHKITDSEGFENLPFKVDEETDLDHLKEFAEAIDGKDDDLVLAVCDTFPYSYPSIEQLAECFQEEKYTVYSGDLADVAQSLVDEGMFGDVSDSLKSYIDYERMGEDLRHDGYVESCFNYVIRYDD